MLYDLEKVMTENTKPEGDLAIRTFAMPKDANASGDIFGGWLMSQLDLAGSAIAAKEALGRVVTVAAEAMQFHKPVFIGDLLDCYGKIVKIGNTSITVHVQAWVHRLKGEITFQKVTEAHITYVALDKNRSPRPVKTHAASK